MLMRRYEMPWRRAYESYAGMGWLAAMAFFVVAGATLRLPRSLALPLAVLCFGMGVLRLVQAVRTLVLRASLSGRGIQVITTTELARWCRKPDEVFLGFGFEWRPVHSQRLYELAKIDYREFTVSPQPADAAWLPVQTPARRRNRSAVHPWRRAERGGTAPAAAKL